MNLDIPTTYVPFGPVGHPKARAFVHLMGRDKSDVEGALYQYLEKNSSQPNAPTMFYTDRVSMQEQGYYVVPVINGNEITDDVLAGLTPCALYIPVPSGAGRSLADVSRHLPDYICLEDKEVWTEGTTALPCDHDIGLESYAVFLKEQYTDKIFASEELDAKYPGDAPYPEGQYYSTFTCSRCGEHHAYPQLR